MSTGDFPDYKGTTAANDDCRPDARVHVDDVELPYCNNGCTTRVRKEGPADIVRESHVQLPVVWGTDRNGDPDVVAEAVNGLSGKTPKRQQCTIELLDPFEDDYVPIHHGFVAAAGGHRDRGSARIRVADFAHLLSNVPASKTWEESASVQSVLDWVRDEFLDGQEVVDELGLYEASAEDNPLFHSDEFVEIDAELREILPPNPEETTSLPTTAGAQLRIINSFLKDVKSFKADRDSLSDVLDWLCNRLNARWYFLPQPSDEPPRLVIEKNPTSTSFHDTDHVTPPNDHSKPIKLLENNALYQLNPVNSLRVRGRSPSLTENALNLSTTDDFPIVTVQYDELAEQTEDDYPPNEIEVDATVHDDVEALAKNELKDRLDSAAGGEMTAAPSPFVRPYARIDAVPVCGSAALADLPPVSYEAEEVIHHATTAHEESDPPSPRTVVRCGLYVDESKITVTDRETRDA